MTAIKEWTLQEAQAAQAAALAADPTRSDSDPSLPLFQWVALHQLDALRQQFDAGDGMALLAAVRHCANHDLAMPAWVADAFIQCYDRVLTCRAGSWDDVFGRPYPKGANLNAMRKRRTLRFAVWNEVQRILMSEPDTAIDAGLFERAGAAIRPPIGKTQAEAYYYAAAKMNGAAQRPKG